MITDVKMLINNVGIAGIFNQAQANIKMIGSAAHQLIVKEWFKTATVLATWFAASDSW